MATLTKSLGHSKPTTERIILRAAQYVRMSTEHQQYSTQNQADAIRKYAAERDIEIVRTYADEGKSGLKVEGREAFQRLIEDVQAGNTDFQIILVYDTSRWGRFQDADESAYYEYVCKRVGIAVRYCAEQFENDGSPFSTMVKGFKRSMAGEYSRELSLKVFAGQCRLIERGYRQGGPAGFGLRRQLIDQKGIVKGILSKGEHKSIQTDRVVLIPGPPDEIETVRWIYKEFCEQGRSESEIAHILNERGILSDLNRQWTKEAIHQVLINEKYIGNNVWNRTSFKLKEKRTRNKSDRQIRVENAFAPIVDRNLFEAAQSAILARSRKYTDQEMLDGLRRLLHQHGFLTGLLINETDELPSSLAYKARFGSLPRAYHLIGFIPNRDCSYIEENRAVRAMLPRVMADAIAGIKSAGGHVQHNPITDILTINSEFTASLVVARYRRTVAGYARWNIRINMSLLPDITVAIRMDQQNERARDYYLLPRIDICVANVRLAEQNSIELDAYRFDSLSQFFDLTARAAIWEAA